ncbi:MAG: hypothetical protein M3364_05645 [Actinomycetota bacterium]|nr:hypothetical protein [Actinomycetota bacterium]
MPWERCGVMPRRSTSRILATMLITMGGASLAGCSGGDSPPERLLDESEASAPPVELEEIDDSAVLTVARIVQPSEFDGTRSASCLDRGRRSERPRGPSVERIGVYSETVTFEEKTGRAVFGCDNTSGSREGNRRWCGGAYGQLYSGRLRDPRLNIACRTDDDEVVGFAWVQPGERARYVSVEQRDYVEVYEVASNLPVRVATRTGVEVEGSRATFDLLEHDGDGRLLRRYSVDAAVAG